MTPSVHAISVSHAGHAGNRRKCRKPTTRPRVPPERTGDPEVDSADVAPASRPARRTGGIYVARSGTPYLKA